MHLKRILVACSGGPDSMALLDKLNNKNSYYLEVGHVNYHKRETASRDEKIVKDYCKNNNLSFHVLNINPMDVKGNFQAYARVVRYEWFNKLCTKYNLEAVYVAHQQDDVIETYLMQKKKGLDVDYYGIRKTNCLYGVKVVRPLLNCSKNSLQEYCDKKGIKYGIDESNLTDNYERNKIRHSIVDKLNKNERKELIQEINELNKTKEEINKQAINLIKNGLKTNTDKFLSLLCFEEIIRIVASKPMSKSEIKEISRQLTYNKNYKLIGKKYVLVKEYNKVSVFVLPKQYSYDFDEVSSYKTPYFKMCKKSNVKMSCAFVKNEDFPLTIRCFRDGDFIRMRYGSKKINRFFIDKKIEYKDRLIWPIVVNRNNEVILVPGIGCDKGHYSEKPNLYVIKL
ncbi:MAG: tRNA lysidine(34) synthetase TilS [Erysipelotrichaceae bacterium]|nr:tRNA lysidine(34) synthetase TilS [Erysipelotrichaceae bacterium]